MFGLRMSRPSRTLLELALLAPEDVPQHLSLRQRANHLLLREHDGNPEHVLLANARRLGVADTVLGHLHWSREEGPAVAQE